MATTRELLALVDRHLRATEAALGIPPGPSVPSSGALPTLKQAMVVIEAGLAPIARRATAESDTALRSAAGNLTASVS